MLNSPAGTIPRAIRKEKIMPAFGWTRRAAIVVSAIAGLLLPATVAHAETITIRNVMNNKCLELYAFNNNNGARSGMWDCWGGANQSWYWDGSQIRNVLNNKCLEIYAFNNNNGAQVGLWDCWGGGNQRWYRNGQEIRSAMNNKCLEIYAFNNANGAKVVTWDCWGGANQHWY
jgi:hypothetical protein